LLTVIVYEIYDPEWEGDGSVLFTGIMYLTLGISFTVVSLEIIKELKKHFSDFYDQIRFKLIVAALGLTLPMLLRGSIDTASNYWGEAFDRWTDVNENYYNLFVKIFCNLDLIAFQLSTMIFGLVRYQREK
jgi:hypothetical protein